MDITMLVDRGYQSVFMLRLCEPDQDAFVQFILSAMGRDWELKNNMIQVSCLGIRVFYMNKTGTVVRILQQAFQWLKAGGK